MDTPTPSTPSDPHERGRDRRILLVDCDAFYVQVARLEDPDGAGRAELLIVGGSESGRGVVTSASYPCRAFGVRSAMPTAHALRLCPEAMVVPVAREACTRRSREVRAVLEEHTPVVQAASIDEFYLDFTGTDRLLRGESLEGTARRLQRLVLEQTGIHVSVGGGTNRLVAKLAVSRAKPAGVFIVPPGDEAAFVGKLDLADLPGVGPTLVDTLAAHGLRSVHDALAVEPEWLARWIGAGRAHWLRDRMRGIDTTAVTPGEPRRSVSSERTFARDVDDDDALGHELAALVDSVSATLRREGLRARTLTVKLRDGDFTTRQRSHTFGEPVTAPRPLLAMARHLLDDLRERRRTPARLLGVGLSGLEEGDAPEQLGLFGEDDAATAGESAAGAAPPETARDRALARALDDVRARFGDAALMPGRLTNGRPSRPAPEDD